MSEQENEPWPDGRDRLRMAPASAFSWILVGALLAFFGGAVASGDDDSEMVGAIIAAVGGLLLTIGAIAKGVEIGIRSARD